MSITNLSKKLFSPGCRITLTFIVLQTALYISYLYGCKIASQITCIVRKIKQFCNINTGPKVLIVTAFFFFPNHISLMNYMAKKEGKKERKEKRKVGREKHHPNS